MSFRWIIIFALLTIAPAAADDAAPTSPDTKKVASASVDQDVLNAENRRIEVINNARQAVLAVFAGTGQGGGGSGVIISRDGLALTNYHVTKPCGHWMKCGMADGKLYDAVLVGLDPTGDVALIQLLGRDDFPHATLGDSDEARAGDWVYAMGNPFLLATNLRPTVTHGILSGTHRYQYPAGTLLEYTDCLQTDAAINPGNSGGPLFDARGRLIGINGRCSFEKRGRISVGVGYAISINQIKHFLGYLQSGRIVDHATLGFRVAFDDDGRVLVNEILDSSDAYRRGLRFGDEIVQFAGRAIDSPNALQNVVGIFPKGWRLPMTYRRKGERHDMLVRLAGLHNESKLWAMISAKPKASPHKGNPHKKGPGKKPKHDLPDKHPVPLPTHGKKVPLPEVVKKQFEQRRGYANYFYNRQQQQRLWQGWTTSFGRFEQLDTPWTITGTIASGKPFRIEVNEQGGYIELPDNRIEWTGGEDLAADLTPPHSGGLLPTLSLWRRLATRGLDQFGQVYYLGTAPLAGCDQPVDVLVGIHGGVTCRFYFDPVDSRLLALEMFPADEADPCEIYWNDYREVDGRLLPTVMEVRYGNETYGRFSLDPFAFEPNTEP